MAAGLGFKDFTTGEVLTAADVDGYLMQGVWVFASAAARDAAVTSPQEGNFAYLKDTNVTTYYTGSAWANLDTTGMTNPMTTTGDMIYSSSGSTPARLGIGTANQQLRVNSGATAPEWFTPTSAASGLTLVQRSSFSNVAGTSTTFDSVFTSTYKSYMVVVENIYGATQGDNFELQFIYSGTTQITDYKMTNPYSKNNSSSMSFLNTAAGTAFSITNNIGNATYPTKAQFFINGVGGSSDYANIRGQVADLIGDEFYIPNGYTEIARAYTGILFKSSSSNVSGTVAVYGLAA